MHLQRPSVLSQVSPEVAQVTPVQGGTGTHLPLALQVKPAPQEVELQMQVLFAPQTGVVLVAEQAGEHFGPVSGVLAGPPSGVLGPGHPVSASARTAPRHTHVRLRTFIRDSLIKF